MTERHIQHADQRHIWRSRDHRRGLRHVFWTSNSHVWRPETLNPWIGWGFVVGSALFGVGSFLALRPVWTEAAGISEMAINGVFFVGSIFFTIAAYLQLFQAANTGDPIVRRVENGRFRWIGWYPTELGWLACFFQFVGTLLFNISTLVVLGETGSWLRQDLTIWIPDLFGSVLFLVSGYIAFTEAAHRFWAWQPADVTWWSVTTNLAGCVAFMISAIYAFVPRSGPSDSMVQHSIFWTLVGAICFMGGALLMLVEDRQHKRTTVKESAADAASTTRRPAPPDHRP